MTNPFDKDFEEALAKEIEQKYARKKKRRKQINPVFVVVFKILSFAAFLLVFFTIIHLLFD